MPYELDEDNPYRIAGAGSAQDPDPYNPTKGMSNWELYKAGMGKHFYDVGRAAGQMIPVYRDGQWTTLVTPKDVDESRVMDAPLMATTPGAAGYNTTAGVLAAATGGRNIPAAVASGMTWGALQPTGSQDSRAANMATGTAFEVVPDLILAGLGRGTKAALSGPTSDTPQQTRDIVRQMQKEGFKVSPGQASTNRRLRSFQDALRQTAWGSGPFDEAADLNTKLLNRKVAQSFGEAADVVDAAVLNKAHTRLGRFFNSVAKQPIVLDDQFRRAVADIDPASIATWTENDTLAKVIQRAKDAATPNTMNVGPYMDWNTPQTLVQNPVITGEEYKTIRSGLDSTARGLLTQGKGSDAHGLWKIMDALDNAVERSLGTETKRAWRQARREYRNLLTAEDAVSRTMAGRIGGDVESVSQAVKTGKTNARRLTRMPVGRDPMIDAARYSDVLRQMPDNSATARRQSWQRLLPTGGAGMTGAGLGAVAGNAPGAMLGAAAGIGLEAGTERTLAKALMSPDYFNYFSGYNGGLPLPGGISGRSVAAGMETLDPYVLQLLGSYPLGWWMGQED